MQISGEIAAAVGVLSSVFSAGLTYGVMSAKVSRLERDVAELRDLEKDQEKEFVTHVHLNAVLTPIGKALDRVQHDVSKILMMLVTPAPSVPPRR